MVKQKSRQTFKSTIIVTGGLGFIGSNYLNKYVLIYPDTRYINVDAVTYAANKNNIHVASQKNYVFEKANICDAKTLKKIFAKYRPTGVIHFAAESHVDRSIANPNVFLETNIIGTSNLLALAKQYAVQRFLYISTDEVYGMLNDKNGIFTEATPVAPRNPYSASKAGGEHLAKAYYETFGLNVVITRSSNNYGPNQDDTKLMSLFIRNLLRGEQVPVYGKGKNIRDWLYVEDNVEAVDLVFRKGKPGEVYNIGGGNEIENIAITKMLIKLAGRDLTAIKYVPDRLGHDFRYALSSEKIKRELGWEPKVKFSDGIKKAFEFYRKRYIEEI